MSVFGKPGYLKTYGRQKRRVEQWFSPDLRKQAFSFSSTLSSEESVTELGRKTNKKKSIASASSRTLRVAKQNALKALLKELESDEESDFIPETATRRKPNTKLIKTAVTSPAQAMQSSTSKKKENVRKHTRKRRKIQPDLGNSENENATHISNKCSKSRSSHSKHIKQGESADPPHLDRFVTQRKKVLDLNSNNPAFKENLGISSNSFDTSKDLICGVPSFSHHVTNRKRPTTQQEIDSKPSVVLRSSACNHSRTVLREVSFNDVEERMMSCKHPLLSSTPSLERNLRCLEPSISELSPFSFDDFDKPRSINQSTASGLNSKARKNGTLKKGAKHTPTDETVQLMEEQNAINSGAKYANASSPLKHLTCSNIEIVSTPLSMKLKQLKERAVIMLGQSDDNRKQEVEKTYSPRSDVGPATSVTAISSCPSKQTCQLSSDYAMSDASIQPLHLTSSLGPSSFSSISSVSAPPPCEISSSLQAQIDNLKLECLSSCLTVRLHRLDLSTIRKAQEETTESLKSQVASPLPLKTEGSQNTRNLKNVPCAEDTKSAGPSPDQELSGSFMLSSISPAPITAPGKMPLKKENVSCTSRKVCVSGLNSSRWSKRGTCEQNRKKRTKLRDCSSNDLLPTGAESYMGESACDWLQSSRVNGLPKTPLRVELLNLTDFLTGFTPDSLTTHTWGRLKAALSVHKKMTAFPTPQRLALSKLKHPGLDTSLDLFGTPVCNQASSHLLQSSINNTSMISHYEDISDAEKVYQECQQDGPILFDDCIPPERMKHCIKIGEGTFGEVFSMFNDARQTVALKIIPVEGHQKVNGEPQKSFGEILHEIIISKELSELNSKEHNKTNGFIGLIDLHCVRGCYPGALLKAWDKFDQEKGSDNDRPDFFGKEQLFLILEFEFGGNDLENMNGKLTSMAQAKSVLHQVTAALAVAEEALSFEHRDLHWGNILVKNTKQKHIQFILNDSVHSIETRGVHVNIIDYSLSRLEIDGLTVSCDIANEEELFMGQGDYQFEIYRLMKSENNNCWADYNPHSNVLWLHYLADKLLTMKYRSKIQTSQQKALKSSLKSFHSEILNYRSAKDVLLHCPLLK